MKMNSINMLVSATAANLFVLKSRRYFLICVYIEYFFTYNLRMPHNEAGTKERQKGRHGKT